MTENSTIANLENFGMREIAMAGELMTAYAGGLAPSWFSDSGVTVEFNPNSGNVFLVNDEYQVLMGDIVGGLYSFYFLSYHGNEGSAEDLYLDFQNGNIGSEDYEELAYILGQEGMEEEAENVRSKMEENK